MDRLPKLPPGVDPEKYVKGSLIQRHLVFAIMGLLTKKKAPLLLAIGACCRVAGKLGARWEGIDRAKFARDCQQVMLDEYDKETERLVGPLEPEAQN